MKATMYNISFWKELNNKSNQELMDEYKEKLSNCGFGICGEIEKAFTPQGYTMLILLSESHFAIHTFPEENTYYIELSSCVKDPFLNFIKVL
nr:MAG TPA: S-adenosylmethionine decarboxylase [Caudoviricetes sp.]